MHRLLTRFSCPDSRSALGFPARFDCENEVISPPIVYLGADSVLGVSAQQISVLCLNVIAIAYAVGVFGAHYRSSIFLIVLLVTVLSMALYPRFCSLEWGLRPRVERYLAYFGVPICLAGFLLSYVNGVFFLRIFRVQEIRPLLLVLAAYSGLFL
jgi:hypothetical protein